MGARPSADLTGAATERERSAMVATQLRRRGIADERVLAAMGALPREWFVDPAVRRHAYDDAALPIASGQSISQPYMVARMTELLAVRPDDRILEIGTGSGYQAAVLATLGARVLSIERFPDLAKAASGRLADLDIGDRIEVRIGDGSLGAPEDAPFDGIVVTAGSPVIPSPLLDQLADGGRLVIPVGPRDRQRLIVATRHGNDWEQRPEGDCVFVPLVGVGGWHGVGRYTRPDHEPRFRRPTPGRRRALVRRPDRQPARARPARHDRHRLLRRGNRRRADALPA